MSGSYVFDDGMERGEGNSGGLKHESAERIFRLLQFLLANECTRKDVFEHLAFHYRIDRSELADDAVSRRANRMFERDIKFLEDQGFEIKKVRGKARPARYSIVKGSGPRAAFLFTEAEVDSLALLHTIFADPNHYTQADSQQPLPLQPPRNPFSEEMQALIEKFVSTLPPSSRPVLSAMCVSLSSISTSLRWQIICPIAPRSILLYRLFFIASRFSSTICLRTVSRM